MSVVRLALEVLKERLEVRGLNCKIEGQHPFVILNSIGGLLGEHPGFNEYPIDISEIMSRPGKDPSKCDFCRKKHGRVCPKCPMCKAGEAGHLQHNRHVDPKLAQKR